MIFWLYDDSGSCFRIDLIVMEIVSVGLVTTMGWGHGTLHAANLWFNDESSLSLRHTSGKLGNFSPSTCEDDL
jgi:hypothetical protein